MEGNVDRQEIENAIIRTANRRGGGDKVTEATPRPWAAITGGSGNDRVTASGPGGWALVASCPQGEDDAALIVRAVNRDHHFGALVEHLRRMIDDLSSVSYDGYAYNIEPALAALRAAEEVTDTTPLCCGCKSHEDTS